MKKYKWEFIYIILLLAVAFYYNYHETVFKRPQSVHKWRQSDCASIALNYYQNGMDFFNPETHNLTSDGGTTGNACPSEVPLLYYMVAVLYKIFGYHELIFRILNTLLFFIGLYYLFKLYKYLLHDTFWAISLSILIFTSPVLVYYGNNFLSNSSAFAFSIVALYYFIRFYFEGDKKWFVFSIVFFLLAASFKITALLSLVAILGVFFIELLGITTFRKNKRLFKNPVSQLLWISSVFIIIGAWILYARYYNLKHDCFYFSTTVFPVWAIGKEEILRTFDTIYKVWLPQYFHPSVMILLLVSLFFIGRYYRKNLKLLNFIILFLLGEVFIFSLLQFGTFRDHDYYTINMYIVPVILLGSIFLVLKTLFEKVFSSLLSKFLFMVFLLFNIYYAQKVTNDRYTGWMNNYGKLNDTYSATSALREMGITEKDTVISIPDASNASLYLMNQKGWTEYTDARFDRGNPIRYNTDSLGIQESIDRGAKYLIVNGIGQLYYKPYLQHYCTHLKGRYNDILVFDLSDKQVNFNLKNRSVKDSFFCDSEILTENKEEFIGKDSTNFKDGNTQSAEFSFSGKFSCKLSKKSSYGMTITMNTVKFGESFQISVWRKKGGKGHIIASASDFYYSDFDVVETKSGWEKLVAEFFVTMEHVNKDLVIYLYNPNTEPAYFDDFRIVRYNGVIL